MIELLVAAGLSAAFATVVGSAFISTSSLARDSLNKASMGQDVREVADAAARFLAGASPAGTCADTAPPSPIQVDSCVILAETRDVFITATPLVAKFYSYTTPPEVINGRTVLSAPDIIEMKYEDNAIIVTRQSPSSIATYTSPNDGTRPAAEAVRAFDTEPLEVLFRYYDAAGNQLGCSPPALVPGGPAVEEGPTRCSSPGPLTEISQLQSIALVEVMPRSTRTISGETETVGMDILVSIDQSGREL